MRWLRRWFAYRKAMKVYNSPDKQAGRDTHWAWRREIEKYLPQLGAQSFIGPEQTIRWLFRNVDIKPEAGALAERLKTIEVTMPDGRAKSRARIEAMFPKLGGGREP
jgi:hypothetical protein